MAKDPVLKLASEVEDPVTTLYLERMPNGNIALKARAPRGNVWRLFEIHTHTGDIVGYDDIPDDIGLPADEDGQLVISNVSVPENSL